MDKNTILKLTLVQFGLMQDPPLEENTLRLIQSFSNEERKSDEAHDSLWWERVMNLEKVTITAGSSRTQEEKAELDASFRKRLNESNHRLSITTVSDVINGWFANAEAYSKNPDWNWRGVQKNMIMNPFLQGLQYLGFPKEDIVALSKSADYVAQWRPSERDTSHDAGP